MPPTTRAAAKAAKKNDAGADASLDDLDEDTLSKVVWATTESGLIAPPAALRNVNKRLRKIVDETRIWRDEWVDALMERCELEGDDDATRSEFEAGGTDSIEQIIEDLVGRIKWKMENGWPREQAEAFTVITAALKAPLAAAVRERSDRYALSTHVVCEALAQRAKRMTEAAPLVYKNLTGTFGLATEDPAWAALMRPEASAGLCFVTNGLGVGDPADSENFPDDNGFYKSVNRGGEAAFELQDSDVVCFRSAAADKDGYHSLIQISGGFGYQMPPLATVTLEKVEQPGEWEVCGHKVQRRLFTVKVTYPKNMAEHLRKHLRA